MQFNKINLNPKNKKTTDCVIRSISYALNKEWENTYLEMANYCCKKGYMLNDKKGFKSYLKHLGYEMEKMPRRLDNTRYTVKEFADELAKPNTKYLISIASHLTVLDYNTLVDTWDCSYKSVGNYWIIKN